MASQVLSGSSNPSYTNNTGQNVRVIINYMASCTSMNWAGVSISGTSSPVGKEVMTINGEFRTAVEIGTGTLDVSGSKARGTDEVTSIKIDSTPLISAQARILGVIPTENVNLFYVPLTVTRGGTFPNELVLSDGQSFSAVSGAYNIVVIREDGN